MKVEAAEAEGRAGAPTAGISCSVSAAPSLSPAPQHFWNRHVCHAPRFRVFYRNVHHVIISLDVSSTYTLPRSQPPLSPVKPSGGREGGKEACSPHWGRVFDWDEKSDGAVGGKGGQTLDTTAPPPVWGHLRSSKAALWWGCTCSTTPRSSGFLLGPSYMEGLGSGSFFDGRFSSCFLVEVELFLVFTAFKRCDTSEGIRGPA